MKGWGWAVMLGVVVMMAGCEPSPGELARARQVDASTEATATAAAIDARARATTAAGQAIATVTAAAWQAESTRTAWMLSVQATQTAVPHDAGRDHAAATTEATREWAVAVLGVTGGLVVLLMCGFMVAAWMQTRARALYPSKTGQMPLVLQGGAVVEPNRQLGAGVVTPRGQGALWSFARVWHYLRTREVIEAPEPRLALADGGATAAQYLAAADGASRTATVAAMFQPTKDVTRQAKIELLEKGKGPLGIRTPQTRVVATGDEAIKAIAAQLGDKLPQLQGPQAGGESGEYRVDGGG